MCIKSGAVACAPPIVRDESSRVFLGGALQQSPPLRRLCSMVGQFSLEVNRKDQSAVRRRPPLLSSKPAEMRAFYSGTDMPKGLLQWTAFLKRLRLDSATGPNQIDEAVKRSIEGPLPGSREERHRKGLLGFRRLDHSSLDCYDCRILARLVRVLYFAPAAG